MNRDLNELEKRCGYTFQDKNLFHRALTHSSYANEHKKDKAVCNERLEFLGDAVLEVTSIRRSRRGSFPKSVPVWYASRLWPTVRQIWNWAAICSWERVKRPLAEESAIPWFPMLWRL